MLPVRIQVLCFKITSISWEFTGPISWKSVDFKNHLACLFQSIKFESTIIQSGNCILSTYVLSHPWQAWYYFLWWDFLIFQKYDFNFWGLRTRIEYKVVYTYDTFAQNRLERPECGRAGQPGTVRGGTDRGSTERLRLLTLESRVWKPYRFAKCVLRSDLYHYDINTCKLWFIYVTDPV